MTKKQLRKVARRVMAKAAKRGVRRTLRRWAAAAQLEGRVLALEGCRDAWEAEIRAFPATLHAAALAEFGPLTARARPSRDA